MAKYVDLIGWDDCPHLQPPHLPKEERDAFEAGLTPHQREARKTGRPSLGAGQIYQVTEDAILTDPIPIPPHWGRAYALDVGWRVTAAIFAAHDPDADVFYLTHEHYGKEAAPVVHAHAIKLAQPYPLLGAIDPAADQSNQKDGTKLREEYEKLGLELATANNAVEAGILAVLIMMQTGRLKVFRTLTNWIREFRLYHRDEKGKIVKKNDHLLDATRYVLNTDGIFRQDLAPRGRAAMKQGEW